MTSAVDKYLALYAEPEARALLSFLNTTQLLPFDSVIVLPVSGESEKCFSGLELVSRATSRLLVVVVINSETTADPARHAADVALSGWIRTRYKPRLSLPDVALRFFETETATWLVLERTGPLNGLPPKTGVGLARKLGSDLAVALWRQGCVKSPWVFHCDADTQMPALHLQQRMPERGAVSCAFRHVRCGDAGIDSATLEYELRLRYHVLGLLSAKSAYAFHSMGSSLAVHAESYCLVRGFPKRSAGEDFYLLDKVHKVDGVTSLYADPQRIEARVSVRVPFGTGAAVDKQLRGTALRLDHPECFVWLGELLQRISRVIEARALGALSTWLESAPAFVAVAVAELGLVAMVEQALRNTRTQADLARRIHAWLDGLKTLRLVHALGSGLPPQPLEAGLAAPFIGPLPKLGAQGRLAWLQETCETLAQREYQLSANSLRSGSPDAG